MSKKSDAPEREAYRLLPGAFHSGTAGGAAHDYVAGDELELTAAEALALSGKVARVSDLEALSSKKGEGSSPEAVQKLLQNAQDEINRAVTAKEEAEARHAELLGKYSALEAQHGTLQAASLPGGADGEKWAAEKASLTTQLETTQAQHKALSDKLADSKALAALDGMSDKAVKSLKKHLEG